MEQTSKSSRWELWLFAIVLGVVVIGVVVGLDLSLSERFRAFAQRRRLTLPLAFDPGGKAHDSFGLTGVPALVIIDRGGRVRFTHEGYNPAEANFRRDLAQFIKTLE